MTTRRHQSGQAQIEDYDIQSLELVGFICTGKFWCFDTMLSYYQTIARALKIIYKIISLSCSKHLFIERACALSLLLSIVAFYCTTNVKEVLSGMWIKCFICLCCQLTVPTSRKVHGPCGRIAGISRRAASGAAATYWKRSTNFPRWIMRRKLEGR